MSSHRRLCLLKCLPREDFVCSNVCPYKTLSAQMCAHRRLCLLKWDYVCFCLSQYILGSGQRWPIYGVFRDTQLSHTPSVPLNIGVCGQRCVLTPYLWTFEQKCGGQRCVDFITPYLQLCGRDVWILCSHCTYNCVGAEMCGFWGRTLVNILSQWFVLGAAPVNPPSPVSFNHHIFVIICEMMMMWMRKIMVIWWCQLGFGKCCQRGWNGGLQGGLPIN